MKAIVRAAFRIYGTVLPHRAARTLEQLIVRPYAVADVQIPDPDTPGTVRRLPYAHGWLYLTEYGEGPAVLLVHGWGGRGRSLRAFVDPLVNNGYRVLVPDLPAHGASSGRGTNLIESAGSLLPIATAFGPVVGVVTHSFGGAVAAFAWQHGFRADRIVMLAPPQDLHALMLPVAEAIGFPRTVSEQALDAFARRLDFRWDDLRVDRLVRAVSAPMLVIHDRMDRIAPIAHGRDVAAAAPDGQLYETQGLGHRNVLTDPDVIGRTVAFLGSTMSATLPRVAR